MKQDEIDAAIVDAEREAQRAAEARLADVDDRYWRGGRRRDGVG